MDEIIIISEQLNLFHKHNGLTDHLIRMIQNNIWIMLTVQRKISFWGQQVQHF